MDPDLVAAGQERFARWGSHVFTALYAALLCRPAYACRRGVQVLGLTARLETDTKRRLNETAQFHLNVMEPGALNTGGRGYADVRHVRLMHAAVRWLIQNDPRVEWDPAWGTPINQEDLLETLLTFTEIVFEVFDRTGILYSEQDADAYLHTWSLIGHYLGIRDDLLPLTRSQTSVLMPIVRRRQFGPSAVRTPSSWQPCWSKEHAWRHSSGLPGFARRQPCAITSEMPPPTSSRSRKADWTKNLFGPLADLSRKVSLEKLHRQLLQGRVAEDRFRHAARSPSGAPALRRQSAAFEVPTYCWPRAGTSPPTRARGAADPAPARPAGRQKREVRRACCRSDASGTN